MSQEKIGCSVKGRLGKTRRPRGNGKGGVGQKIKKCSIVEAYVQGKTGKTRSAGGRPVEKKKEKRPCGIGEKGKGFADLQRNRSRTKKKRTQSCARGEESVVAEEEEKKRAERKKKGREGKRSVERPL